MSPDARKAILWGAVALIVLLTWSRWDASLGARQDAALDQLFAQSRDAIRYSHQRIAQAREDARITALRARGLAKSLNLARGLSDSLEGAGRRIRGFLDSLSTKGDSLRVYVRLDSLSTTEKASLRQERDTALTLAETWEAQSARWRAVAEQADSVLKVAETSLTTLNKARTCRIAGFLPCLSRSASLLTGLVAGVAVGVLVSR